MIRRFALLFFGSLTLLLSSGLPLYFFFGNGGSSEADWNGRVGEMWALGPQFGSGLGGQPEIGVKSAEIMETSYAVDTYGNKYRVFAAEITWNDASVQSEFSCKVSYINDRNQQEWRLRTAAPAVEYGGEIELPKTFVPRGSFFSTHREDACGILRDQQFSAKHHREQDGPASPSEQDTRRSVTEYIPLPEDLEIDRIIVEVNKPGDVDGDKSEFAVN